MSITAELLAVAVAIEVHRKVLLMLGPTLHTHLIARVVMLMIMNLMSTAMHPSAACAIAPEAAISRRLNIVRRSGRGSYVK